MFTEVKDAVCFFFPGRHPERRGLVSTGLFLPGSRRREREIESESEQP